ncbi:MAG: aminoacyl-tRNA hydrolase [Planctomycetota bacterium]
MSRGGEGGDEIRTPGGEEGVTLVVGLGNPGRRYRGTRHNIGYEVADRLAERLGGGEPIRFHRSDLVELRGGGRRLSCLKPGTFMNRSGAPVAQAVSAFMVRRDRLLVIHDDLDLPLGRLRLRAKGGAGGHRGIADIIAHLGDQRFGRLRLGIGRPEEGPPEDYVLEAFLPEERERVDRMAEQAVEACLSWWRNGIVHAMNCYNPGDPGSPLEEGRSEQEMEPPPRRGGGAGRSGTE